MKRNCWLIVWAMLSSSILAQHVTNSAPAAPIATPAAAPAVTLAPATAKTNAPAAKAGKKKAAHKKADVAPQKKAVAKKKEVMPELKTVPLVPGPAEVVASNVNVRGQAKLKSEVLTRVTKGQFVTVIEEIVRNNSGPEEPSAWAKIVLPPGAHVWVSTSFVNASNETVRPKKLNLRSGPGENYSVVGRLQSGDAVKAVTTKGDWTEVETPTNAYAFIAAQYLKQEAPTAPAATPVAVAPTPVAAAPAPTEPAPAPTTVATAPAVAPPPTEAPTVPAPQVVPAVTNAAAPAPEPTEPVMEEPPPPRIVQREGMVRGLTSIQAPSKFVLISPQDGRDIDYLYTSSKELDLRRYKGLRIIVTGEEGLDERWPNMPVLTIQKIQVVE